MEKEITIDGKHVKFDILNVIDKNNTITSEQIIAINATDIIHLPGVIDQALAQLSKTYPNMKTVYYRVSVTITPLMEGSGDTGINLSADDLKKYEATLDSLKSKY